MRAPEASIKQVPGATGRGPEVRLDQALVQAGTHPGPGLGARRNRIRRREPTVAGAERPGYRDLPLQVADETQLRGAFLDARGAQSRPQAAGTSGTTAPAA